MPPPNLKHCVQKVMRKGWSKPRAYAICVSSTGWRRAPGKKWVKDGKVWKKPTSESVKTFIIDKLFESVL